MAWMHLRVLGHNLIHRMCAKVDKCAAHEFSMKYFPKAIKHLGGVGGLAHIVFHSLCEQTSGPLRGQHGL
jgi:hypothetical protein